MILAGCGDGCRIFGTRLTLFLVLVGVCAFSEEPKPIRIASFNVYNFRPTHEKPPRDAEGFAATIRALAELDADIVVLQEMGSWDDFRLLQKRLRELGVDYPYLSLVYGADYTRHVAFLCKIKPAAEEHRTDRKYSLNGQEVKVRRGFGYLRFEIDDYVLHVLGAHLKSKVFHKLGQTDMRRYEARQLRYVIDELIDEDPLANVLVLGDLNDTMDSSPVKTVLYRRYKYTKRLYDLRPTAANGESWTYHHSASDTYSRIDYALASFDLLPEVDLSQCRILSPSDGHKASDHRPFVVSIIPQNRKDESIREKFSREIREPVVREAEPGKVFGTRKVLHE
ncbi:MAG TPA: hypothetical protein DCR55_05285 [Lentisphaeria bacterium]|nr:hypothetical protein [Lentisphaeria bacterium]